MKKAFLTFLALLLLSLCACAQPCTEHSYGDWYLENEVYVRVCQVCKEKETHTHTFGEWTFGTKEMHHSCVQCGDTETLGLDPELAIKTLLPGHWFFSCSQGEAIIHANELDDTDIGFYLNIKEDGSAVRWNMETLHNGTWSLKEYDFETGLLTFSVSFTHGTEQQFIYDMQEQVVVFPVGDHIVYLTQTRELIPYIAGTYTAVNETGFYRFTLEEDHTIAEFPDAGWHITPIYTKRFLYKDAIAHSYYIDIKLSLPKNGSFAVHKITIPLCPNDYMLTAEEVDSENRSHLQQIGFYLDIGEGKHLYHHHFEEDLELLESCYKAYPALLTSSWIPASETLTGSGEESVSFTSDGKFKADLGQAYSGTWTLFSASVLDGWAVFSVDMKCSNGKMLYALLDPASKSLTITDDGTPLYFTTQ